MNKLPVLTFFLCTLFLFGCNNDLELIAPQKDIPVVYGIFSKQNTDHYLRVERGFIDETINAETLAQDPNNLAYEDAIVRVKVNSTPYILERVNGNEEGLQREEGFFANDPNYLYKLADFSFANADNVVVEIDRGQGFDLVETQSAIPIIDNFTLKSPNPAQGQKVGIRTDDTFFALRYDAPTEAKIFDAVLTFHYFEFPNSGGEPEAKSVTWTVARNQERDDNNEFVLSRREGRDFFNLLLAEIPVNSSVTRKFRKFSVEIGAGGQAFADYIALTQANTGITSSQEVPNFSNLTEGLGLVSSKFVLNVDSLDITGTMRTELNTGDLLSDLNFE